MNKNYIFNRSAFSQSKGHDIKRKSSKGLVTGLVLASTIVLLGASQPASADEATAASGSSDKVVSVEEPPTAADSQTSTSDTENTAASDQTADAADIDTDTESVATDTDSPSSQTADSAIDSDVIRADAAHYHERYDWDEARGRDRDAQRARVITFADANAQSNSSRVSIDGKTITINQAGTYTLTGSGNGYSIGIADNVTDAVTFNLKTLDLRDSNISARKDLTLNILSDSSLASSTANTIEAGGALYISGKNKAALVLKSTVGHAIKADNLKVKKVNLDLTSAKDGIHATKKVTIDGSAITIKSDDDGIKVKDESDVNSADLKIEDSTLTINAQHKGLAAYDEVTVDGASTITITSGHEGIEGRFVNLKKGNITINAGDDGINASEWTDKDDADLSKLKNSPSDIKNDLGIFIKGADISLIGYGDGVDSNGKIIITKGSLKSQNITNYNSALDHDGDALISGGTAWAIGHMGFFQGFSNGTKQAYVSAIVSGLAGDTITIIDSKGRVVAQTTSEVDFDHVVFSSKDIRKGKTYTVTTSDGHTATVTGTKDYTQHSKGNVPDGTPPLLPNGKKPAFPGNGVPPEKNPANPNKDPKNDAKDGDNDDKHHAKLTESDAKSIALSDAGLMESDVKSLKVEGDSDDDIPVYEIEFKRGDTEYDYTINALDGTITEKDIS